MNFAEHLKNYNCFKKVAICAEDLGFETYVRKAQQNLDIYGNPF